MHDLIDKHAMHTWIGLTLWWKPKLVISALIAIGVLVIDSGGELRFRDLVVPRTAFIYGLLWLMALEFLARLYRSVRDGLTDATMETLPLLLTSVLEAIGLYFGYALVLGMTTVLAKTTAGTPAYLVMEGLQLFFFVAIGITQLVMALVHWRGSREAATAWMQGLKRNWTWMRDLSNDLPKKTRDNA